MMRKRSNLYKSFTLASATTLTILMLLSQTTTFAASSGPVNWFGPNGSIAFGGNFSPQTDINSGNVQNLQVQWIFPVPAAPAPYTSNGAWPTPSVVNGIVYFITSWNHLFALDASRGSIVWQKDLPILTWLGKNLTGAHYHALWFSQQIRGKPLVWVFSPNSTLFAYNALTGDLEVKFPLYNPTTISGNFGVYASGAHNMAIDDQRGILVVGSEGSEGVNAPRGFLEGINVNSNPPTVLWRSFIIPPQDGSDPNWAIKSVQNMSYAYIWNGQTKKQVDLKALSPTQLSSMLFRDWGTFAFNGTHSFAGANLGWGGGWALNPRTGLAYVGSAQPGPDYNATTRPGPNLWSDSLLAVDDRTGKFVWGFETTPHDLYDFDCAWNTPLANATISGVVHEAVLKACKNGWVFALDASTGSMYWAYYSPSITPAKEDYLLDPTNSTQMKLPYPTYPKGPTTLIY